MTREQLRTIFPGATESFLTANATLPNTEPERDQAPALGKTVQGEKESMGRVRVRFIGYRVRLLDPDNFAASCKDCIDFLRRVALIKDDNPEAIILETSQVRVKSFKDEKTVVELTKKVRDSGREA